jgi:PAS domain S-box-containing protein
MVRCNGEPVGSLCAVFKNDFICTNAARYIISRLALALEAEETSESLRKSKNRYRELFDFAVEGILIGSPKGIITESNKSIQKMTGFRNEELVGHHISEVLFTPESTKSNPFRFDLLQQDQLVINEREILCKDKSTITVEMHSKMMPDNTYQAVLFDISSRKEAEKKLHLSENTYRGIINSLNDAIYILDENGCFLDVNSAAENLYGYKKEYFIGKNPGFLAAPGMNDIDQTSRFISEAYNGKPARFEFWGIRKDGSRFPKEVSLSPGMWFDQKIVIAVGREMSERKIVEESLRISEEKYRLLVQYSSDPIFSFNADESYRFVNDAFAGPFGKKPEEIIGKTPYDIFPPDEAEKRLRLVRKVFNTGEKGEIEVKVVNIHGEEKFYLTMVDPIKDAEGNILWVTCIAKEITQRKKAEEELKLKNELLNATNAEKDKFFSIVAHDLRGPMNGFLGLTGIMADDIESLSASELKEIATTMRTSAVNIYRLIENLLEWSKMQRGILNFEPQPLFLKLSLTKSIELMMDTANKKGIDLRINIPDHTVVIADIHMLETIIRNLISNALKFSFKGGIIEISAEKTVDDMVRVVITDNGIGMSPELLEKLFTLTENINRKGTEGEPSTGLGLILCKEFVEKQGGKIWAESVEGEGSSFIFTLPQL